MPARRLYQPAMVRIARRLCEIVLCLPLAAGAGGCSRTDDGTVVIPPSLDVRRVWRHDDPALSSTVVTENPTFPVAPVFERGSDRRATVPRRRIKTAPEPERPPVACHMPADENGRVQMMCD